MVYVDMTETDCWCGLPFSVPTRLYNQCKKTGKTFYCPLGHTIVFKETDADKFRRERDRLKQNEAFLKSRITEEEHRAAAFKGQVTKLKKRASAGVCPCCNRTFQNLARHMSAKHPQFTDEPDLKVVEGGKK